MMVEDGEQEEGRERKEFLCRIRKKRIEPLNVGRVPLMTTNDVLRLNRGAWSMVKLQRQETNEYAPLTRDGFVNWDWRRLVSTALTITFRTT